MEATKSPWLVGSACDGPAHFGAVVGHVVLADRAGRAQLMGSDVGAEVSVGLINVSERSVMRHHGEFDGGNVEQFDAPAHLAVSVHRYERDDNTSLLLEELLRVER